MRPAMTRERGLERVAFIKDWRERMQQSASHFANRERRLAAQKIRDEKHREEMFSVDDQNTAYITKKRDRLDRLITLGAR